MQSILAASKSSLLLKELPETSAQSKGEGKLLSESQKIKDLLGYKVLHRVSCTIKVLLHPTSQLLLTMLLVIASGPFQIPSKQYIECCSSLGASCRSNGILAARLDHEASLQFIEFIRFL